tara:strand:- start:2173 stop:2373 length:201 start_codon:yes stop_codon:yes gene_type:complete
MDHGDKKKMGMGGRTKAMYGGMKREKKMGGGMKKRSMYMEGGETHSGTQPMYGSTVADAMPKGTAN